MPKVVPLMTEKALKSAIKRGEAKKTKTEITVGGVPGLVLRVRPGEKFASCVWFLRDRKRKTRNSLGTYPETSLAGARDKARRMLDWVERGNAPETFMQLSGEAPVRDSEDALTFGDAFEEWSGHWIKTGGRKHGEESYRSDLRQMRRHLSSLWSKPVETLEPQDMADAFRPIWKTMPPTCKRLISNLGLFFQWCAFVKKCRTSPDNIAKKPYLKQFLGEDSLRKQEEHYPFIPPERVPELFRSLFERGAVSDYAAMFTIMCALRNGNARSLRWDQINTKEYQDHTYTVAEFSKEDMKCSDNGQHVVPLSDECLAILKLMEALKVPPGVYVFSIRGSEISEGTIGKAIKDSHAREVKAGREGWKDPETGRIAVPHGLARAGFKTKAVQMQSDVRATELVLHHTVDKDFGGAYDRDASINKKAEILQSWSTFCCSLIRDELLDRAARRGF